MIRKILTHCALWEDSTEHGPPSATPNGTVDGDPIYEPDPDDQTFPDFPDDPASERPSPAPKPVEEVCLVSPDFALASDHGSHQSAAMQEATTMSRAQKRAIRWKTRGDVVSIPGPPYVDLAGRES